MKLLKPMKFTKYDAMGLAVCTVVLLAGMTPAFAAPSIDGKGGFQDSSSTVGAGVKDLFADTIFGNLGLIAGVFFAAFGAYQWLVKQSTAVGIGSIIFGAVLALSDDLMTAITNTIAKPAVDLLKDGGASTGGTTTLLHTVATTMMG